MTRLLNNVRAHTPNWLKNFIIQINLARIGAAKLLLPRKCYVQVHPNSFQTLGYFPELRREMSKYNYDTSIAQKGLAIDGNRVVMFRMMLRHVADLPTGEYAELGIFRGITARLILRHMNRECELHCFDTFAGFDNKDIGSESKSVKRRNLDRLFRNTSIELAKRIILDGETDCARLFLHPGYFPSTFRGLEDRSWRFVHLDADLYLPTLAGIKVFYPKLVPGGVMLLHDYYSFFDGVRRASDEYFSKRGVTVVPMPDKAGTGIVIKSTR